MTSSAHRERLKTSIAHAIYLMAVLIPLCAFDEMVRRNHRARPDRYAVFLFGHNSCADPRYMSRSWYILHRSPCITERDVQIASM